LIILLTQALPVKDPVPTVSKSVDGNPQGAGCREETSHVRHHGVVLRITVVAALLAGLLAAVNTATANPAAKAHSFTARGSAKQVDVTGLAPKAKVTLLDRSGHRVATKTADSLGGLVFYSVKPGSGYRVRVLPSGRQSRPITVHSNRSKPWDPKIYKQSIPDHGYGYLTTRDGTKLAYDVHPPTSPAGLGLPPITLPPGVPDYAPPYPTLIEYSGYGYANPAGPESGIAILANLMGFAVVDVNMRGTGCSGGAYNFFEPLQDLDGYDVIETVAHQSWVRGHKVGMMGISFGAISQLFTAQTHPPSLAAFHDRCDSDDPLPRRRAERRVRGRVGERAPAERRAGDGSDPRTVVGVGPDQGRGQDLQTQPGAAW